MTIDELRAIVKVFPAITSRELLRLKLKDKIMSKLLYTLDSNNYSYEEWDDELDTLKENFSNDLLLTGNAGLWCGNRELEPQKVAGFEEFLNLKADFDSMEIEVYENRIEFVGHHHDGSNFYRLEKMESLTNKELRDFLKDNVELDEINEFLKDGWLTTLSKAPKIALVDAINELID